MDWLITTAALAIGIGLGATGVALLARRKNDRGSTSRAVGALEQYIANAPLVIIEWDADFRVVRWSPRAVDVFGWTAEEVTGRHFSDFNFVHEDDIEAVGPIASDLIEGRVERNTSLNRNYRKDGTFLHCQWSNSVRRDRHGKLESLLSFVDDVTAQVESQAIIEQQRDELQLVLDVGEEGIWDWNIDSNSLRWSEHHFEILGLHPHASEPDVAMHEGLIHPDDLSRRRRSLATHLERGDDYRVEYRMRHADGSWIWIFDCGRALHGADGHPYRMIGAIADITSRKHAEAALQSERDLLDGIMRTSVAAITVVNPAGEITFANDAARRVLGLNRDETTSLSHASPEWTFTDFDGRPFPEENLPFRRVMRSGKPVFDVRHAIRWPDGTRKFLSVNGAPLRGDDGEIIDVVLLVDDTTHRVDAENALRQSEASYRTLVEGSPEGIHEVDGDGLIVSVNRAAHAILGTTDDNAVVGRHIAEFVAPEHREPIEANLARALEAEVSEFECMLADGRMLACSLVPLPDRLDGAPRLMWLTTDVTERRALEARQQLMMAELDHRVKNMLASMVSLAEQTANTSGSLEEFAECYIGRLRSLARTHEALAATKWSGVDLLEVLQLTVLPFANDASGNVSINGVDVRLPPEAAAPVCLSLHELTTNALRQSEASYRTLVEGSPEGIHEV
ncbi:MAG: PAS domain S-box protein, partial [Planctomycetota bacterium]